MYFHASLRARNGKIPTARTEGCRMTETRQGGVKEDTDERNRIQDDGRGRGSDGHQASSAYTRSARSPGGGKSRVGESRRHQASATGKPGDGSGLHGARVRCGRRCRGGRKRRKFVQAGG